MTSPVGRRTVLGLAATALAGCLDAAPAATATPGTDNPLTGDADQRGSIALTSPAFEDGEPIPREYGRGERDVNPPLRIEGVPEGAASLVLVMDDPDAVGPADEVSVHWLVWNIDPGTETIPEDWDGGDAAVGTNDFGERGYGGPAPPYEAHTYRFKLYAVDTAVDREPGATLSEVGEAVSGHVVARTQLTGTYEP